MTGFIRTVKGKKTVERCSNDPIFHTNFARRLHARWGYAPATANALADAFLQGKGGRHEWS